MITFYRDMFSYGIYFVCYEFCKRKMINNFKFDGNLIPFSLFVSGGIAGCLAWASIYPVDVVKSRVQADIKGEYKNFWDCLLKTYKFGGIKLLFKGFNPTMYRAFFLNGVTF